MAKHFAKLVLGCDRGDAHAGARHLGKDRRGAHRARIDNHNFFAGRPVEIIVSGNAMNRGRRARHNRNIVRIGEGRHRRVGECGKAVAHHPRDVCEYLCRILAIEIARVAAIETDHHRGALRFRVGSSVYLDHEGPSFARIFGFWQLADEYLNVTRRE